MGGGGGGDAHQRPRLFELRQRDDAEGVPQNAIGRASDGANGVDPGTGQAAQHGAQGAHGRFPGRAFRPRRPGCRLGRDAGQHAILDGVTGDRTTAGNQRLGQKLADALAESPVVGSRRVAAGRVDQGAPGRLPARRLGRYGGAQRRRVLWFHQPGLLGQPRAAADRRLLDQVGRVGQKRRRRGGAAQHTRADPARGVADLVPGRGGGQRRQQIRVRQRRDVPGGRRRIPLELGQQVGVGQRAQVGHESPSGSRAAGTRSTRGGLRLWTRGVKGLIFRVGGARWPQSRSIPTLSSSA